MKKHHIYKITAIAFILISFAASSCQEDVRVLRSEDPWIVFVSDRNGNKDVYAINPISKEKVLVHGSQYDETSLRYDPQQDRIVFSKHKDNVVLASNNTDLFNSPNIEYTPAWSTKGKIVYSQEETGQSDLYIADSDGNNNMQITDTPESEKYPSWDPSGEKIVYTKQVEDGWDLYIMDVPTGEENRITNLEGTLRHPTWSPDGNKIAFDMDYDGKSEIAYVDIRTMELNRITRRPSKDTKPSWAPDSFTIAFESDAENSNTDIWIIDIGSRELNKLTNNNSYDGEPVFAPYSSIMDFVK